jgi:hypothetical protein
MFYYPSLKFETRPTGEVSYLEDFLFPEYEMFSMLSKAMIFLAQ